MKPVACVKAQAKEGSLRVNPAGPVRPRAEYLSTSPLLSARDAAAMVRPRLSLMV